MSEVIERIKAKFVAEAATTLGSIGHEIEALHAGGVRPDVASRIREQAHGLKGAAAVLEFTEFRDRVAALEETAAGLAATEQWEPGASAHLATLLAAAREAAPRKTSNNS